MKIGRRLISIVLLIAGCIVAVGLAEGVVRLLDPYARDHVLPSGFFIMDAALGWGLQPETTVTHRSRYFTVTYTTNAMGHRDRPRRIEKKEDRIRILFYGDSQVFGWGVPESQRFSNLLEAQRPSLEAWNLAVPAYGLDQQVIAYERGGQRWNADAVVFFVSSATLRRIETAYNYRKYKPRFVLDQSGELRLIPVPRAATSRTSIIYQALSPWHLPYFLERRAAMLSDMFSRPSDAADDPRVRSESSLSRLALALIDRAAGIARARRQRPILLSALFPEDRQALEAFCAQREIRLITLDLSVRPDVFRFGEDDPHWTPGLTRGSPSNFRRSGQRRPDPLAKSSKRQRRVFLITTRKRNSDRSFGHERLPKGEYHVYEISKKSAGDEACEKTLEDIGTDKDTLLLVHGFDNTFCE